MSSIIDIGITVSVKKQTNYYLTLYKVMDQHMLS